MTWTVDEVPDASTGEPVDGLSTPPAPPADGAPPPAPTATRTVPSVPGPRSPDTGPDEDDPDETELLEGESAEAEGTDPPPATFSVEYSSGQVAGVVYGGLHQHFDRVRDYHELTEQHVRNLLGTFVEPGYRQTDGERLVSAEATGLLLRHGGAVLVGAAGTGRRTAALRLLDGTGRTLREIRSFDPARDEQLSITALPMHPEVAYLLELPERAEQVHPGFARDLAAYVEALADLGSYVVVTVTEEVWGQLTPASEGLVLRVGVPPASMVLDAQLRRLLPDLDLAWLAGTPTVAGLLVTATPAEAVRLARLANDILGTFARSYRQDLHGPDQPAAKDLVEALVSAFRNWEAELHTWFGQHPAPRPRLFLVAAAVLAGSAPGRVLRAAELLGNRLGDNPPPGLGEAGVRTLLDEVGAELDPAGRVRFRRPRYGDAVLDFVITDRTEEFERELWRWVARLPIDGTRVDRTVAVGIAELVLRTALRRRSPEILALVTAAWARRPELRVPLVEILELGALSPEIGAAIRRRLYRWAVAQRNHPSVLATVARVCGGGFADFYVEQALVRLGQLARWGQSEVDEAVLAALSSIWRRPVLRTAVLLRLARWLAGPPGPRVALAGRALELLGQPPAVGVPDQLVDPVPDSPTGRVPDDRVDRVLATVGHEPPEVVEAVGTAIGRATVVGTDIPVGIVVLLRRWCDAAAGDAPRTGLVTRLLAHGVATGPAAGRRVARIRGLLHDWQPPAMDHERPERAALREHLVRELHRVDVSLTRHPQPQRWSTNGTV
ncbi:hypothetical protein BDK92_4843 [Micromonospora pisi]|uniref:Uncharacterized protein n=1 Tax=Micromonospora pisi TaxID=589240 RepID=A0A495JN37_9ACTN|nr:hypothetical protein [Micromonospora pisi]RKR90470.1 hypothetical protein BDK92_4843 [Micromonospora pisi]